LAARQTHQQKHRDSSQQCSLVSLFSVFSFSNLSSHHKVASLMLASLRVIGLNETSADLLVHLTYLALRPELLTSLHPMLSWRVSCS
jgi:hypothetical protein